MPWPSATASYALPNHPPLLGRMIDSHIRHRSACTIAVCQVPRDMVHHYGIVVPVREEAGMSDWQLTDIIEKPRPDQTSSYLAVSARYIFGPEIFAAIRTVTPAPNGEIYLTDAISDLIQKGHMVRAVQLGASESRADIGNHQAYFETFIDYAVSDPECGPGVLNYMRGKLAKMKQK